MRNRLLAAGTTLALATFGFTGAAIAGEPTTVTVPVPGPTETVPVPGPTETVTTPAETVTVPGPTKTVTTQAPSKKSSGSGSGSSETLGASSTGTTAAATTTPVATTTETSVDTSSPVGGVQAGAGGMAPDPSSPTTLAIVVGLFAFGLTTAAVTLRRRAAEH
jgi:hypothetical protein